MKEHKTIIELARELRKNQTPAEAIVWEFLRNRRLSGFKFLRQHPLIYNQFNNKLFFFIADFYCNELKLVIEIDGKIHDYQLDYDENRNMVMKKLGLHVEHIKNEEVKNETFLKEKLINIIRYREKNRD